MSKADLTSAKAKPTIKAKRIIIKISGEYLKSDSPTILDQPVLENLAEQIKFISREHEVGVVVGGGNIWRGMIADTIFMGRAEADYMGMLATIINALAVQNACERAGVEAVVYSAIEAPKVAEPYIRRNAINNLRKKRVAIFAGGTGYPFFTTDTAAALRAADIDADTILMAKNGVDGVYTSDPRKDKNAEFIAKATYKEIFDRGLKIMDSTALTLCRDHKINLIVFNAEVPNAIVKAVGGKIKHTLISGE